MYLKGFKLKTIKDNQHLINSLELILTRTDLDNFQIWYNHKMPLSFDSMTLLQGVLYKSIFLFTKKLTIVNTIDISKIVVYEFENMSKISQNYFIEIDLIETNIIEVLFIECYCYNDNEKLVAKASYFTNHT